MLHVVAVLLDCVSQAVAKGTAASHRSEVHYPMKKLDGMVDKMFERALNLSPAFLVEGTLLGKPNLIDQIVTGDRDYIRAGGGFWDERGLYRGPKEQSGVHIPNLARICTLAARGGGLTVQEAEVTVEDYQGKKVEPRRFEHFDDVKQFPESLRKDLKRFHRPSQIQSYTWPLALEGKDLIGVAATGSGKTLAFLLPAFVEMLSSGHKPDDHGPGCLVLAPTRELAQQTEQEAEKFGQPLGLTVVAMYGGASKEDQYGKYLQGVHTIVACPGRLNDFLDMGEVVLANCQKVILDEADRMLDLGFDPQIRAILGKVPEKRHTMFFTATWPKEVQKLANDILSQPFKVMIGNRDVLKGNNDISQVAEVVDKEEKENTACDILRQAGAMDARSECKVLVFCAARNTCETLCSKFNDKGVKSRILHAGCRQRDRDEAMSGFRKGDIKVIVATDVAARGLDIKGIGLVLNYDPPTYNEDYVHRIGRTGRAGVKGYAVSLLTEDQGRQAKGIIAVMQRTGNYVSTAMKKIAGLPVNEEAPQNRYGTVEGSEEPPAGPPPEQSKRIFVHHQLDQEVEAERKRRREKENEKKERNKAQKRKCTICHRAACIC
eukprot:gnl/TRDRNA2_/TRDRNA2_195502_c0_seq1.p1 gnl/TRDRNA2_/TRDRNA2_195502_c0~~gnl/TRDRNA2_/TRDRNA2_195502_c0_seq1.p1  ORF type:complete len:604 (-),score=98.42 gnl/TRDRNA2_/TRDRNA2_195502_c0_seq1:113-1924(-)